MSKAQAEVIYPDSSKLKALTQLTRLEGTEVNRYPSDA
jgi:hypothetical protein